MKRINSESKQLDLSIIIVNYNVKELLKACLLSIDRYTHNISYEVIVIDSNSTDGSTEMLRSEFSQYLLLPYSTNIGFTKGNNIGLKHASGRHICFLNPDTELCEDIFAPLVSQLDSNQQLGVVAPKLLNTDRSEQISVGTYTRISNLLREYLLRTKADTAKLNQPTTRTVVEVVMGACMVANGQACRAVGGFDERYFMYNEETDLCLTLKERGFETVFDPTYSLVHHGSKSSSINEENKQRSQHENRKSQYIFFLKHYGWLIAQIAKVIIIMAMVIRIPILWFISIVRGRSDTSLKIKYYAKTVSWLITH